MTYVVLNWKTYLSVEEGSKLLVVLSRQLELPAQVELVLCPAPELLLSASNELVSSKIKLGAPEVWVQEQPLTGGVSLASLTNLKTEYCLVGHSEQRQYLGETNDLIREKVLALLAKHIKPILCVGETQDEAEAETSLAIIETQLRAVLTAGEAVLIAYEPRFAIGRGVALPIIEATGKLKFIKEKTLEITGVANPVLYGGSVDSSNAAEFLAAGFDGLLIGKAATSLGTLRGILTAI